MLAKGAEREVQGNSFRIYPGGFAVSRALGDINSKLVREGHIPRLLISDSELITADIHEDDAFIVIASDGLWEVFSNEQVQERVMRKAAAKNFQHPTHLAENLVEGAFRAGSMDNLTCVVICLLDLDVADNESARRD